MPILAGYEHTLWDTLLELADPRSQEWALIGGQMVFVHATERDVVPVRASSDLDVPTNARVVTGGVKRIRPSPSKAGGSCLPARRPKG